MTNKMDNKDLLTLCRYYKGENICPFKDQDKVMFWGYERQWVLLMCDHNEEYLSMYITEFSRAGYSKFEMFDHTPYTLKALLYNRFTQWNQSEGFDKWYREKYMR